MREDISVWRSMALALVLGMFLPQIVQAVGGEMVPESALIPPDVVEYNKGLQAKAANRFPDAVNDFRRAVDIRPNFPEAWNELGFALRQTGQYTEALRAYEQALRQRPNYPEALEYMGEAYVKLGRLNEARGILTRLKALDTKRAKELEDAIRAGE
jgi:tetratricopeptide (TPR) repeat protein